jgi:hypothetical protein
MGGDSHDPARAHTELGRASAGRGGLPTASWAGVVGDEIG